MSQRHRTARLVVSLTTALLGLALAVVAPTARAQTTALVQGSGSTWAADAVNQWVADVVAQGLRVVYVATGSATGRADFANQITDFAVSDLPYQGLDPVTGSDDTAHGRQFAYVPGIAGGVAFPYNLSVGGTRVTNLRLSGATLAAIFSGRVGYWDDPRIVADNNGRLPLPHLRVVPVVHSEGSAVSQQVGSYFAAQFPAAWQAFAGSSAATPYWPGNAALHAVNGSDGVINAVSSAGGAGSIAMDEYRYALQQNLPVAKMENASHTYVAPTPDNVAIALTATAIDSDPASPGFGTADYRHVWVNPDVRAYPLSGYSNFLIPTGSTDPRMTTAKRQAIAAYVGYSLCAGQRAAGAYGYAPLPLPLARFGLAQLQRLRQADPGVDLSGLDLAHCSGNPTFTAGPTPRDTLSTSAPLPPACDAAAHGPCGTPADHTVATTPASATIVAGQRPAVATRLVDTRTGRALSGATVALWARPASGTRWQSLGRGPTSSLGYRTVTVRPMVNTVYQFRYAGDVDHVAVNSAAATVRVRPAVSVHATRTTVRRGSTTIIWGAVAPGVAGEVVTLTDRHDGVWRTTLTGRTARLRLPDGTTRVGFALAFRPWLRGSRPLRVLVAATDRNAGGASGVLTITVV